MKGDMDILPPLPPPPPPMATVVVVVRGMVVAAAAPRIRRNKGALERWKRTEVGLDFILDSQYGERCPSKIKTETRLFVFFLAFLSPVNYVANLDLQPLFFVFPRVSLL